MNAPASNRILQALRSLGPYLLIELLLPGGTLLALLLWLYFTGAAIFIGGEINSEIEKAAADAGNPDVRRPGEPRSGGSGW